MQEASGRSLEPMRRRSEARRREPVGLETPKVSSDLMEGLFCWSSGLCSVCHTGYHSGNFHFGENVRLGQRQK